MLLLPKINNNVEQNILEKKRNTPFWDLTKNQDIPFLWLTDTLDLAHGNILISRVIILILGTSYEVIGCLPYPAV